MDVPLMFLLLAFFSSVLTFPDEETDCKKCQPIWPMRDFNEEKVEIININILFIKTRYYGIKIAEFCI